MKESWINWDPGRQGWGAEESMCGVPWVEFHLRSQTSQHDPLQSTQGLSSYSLSLFTSGDEHKKCGKSNLSSHQVLTDMVGSCFLCGSCCRWLEFLKMARFLKTTLLLKMKSPSLSEKNPRNNPTRKSTTTSSQSEWIKILHFKCRMRLCVIELN